MPGLITRRRASTDHLGQAFTWLCGGALAVNLLLTLGLLGLIGFYGLAAFWPKPLVEIELTDGTRLLGEIHDRESRPLDSGSAEDPGMRLRLKTGNRDLSGLDFRWIDEDQIAKQSMPPDAATIERMEWGNFYGRMVELKRGDTVLASGQEAVENAFADLHDQKRDELEAVQDLERGELADVNRELERLRLSARRLEREGKRLPEAERARRQAEIDAEIAARQSEYEHLAERLHALRDKLAAEKVVLESVDGQRKEIDAAQVVRIYEPNRMGFGATLRLFGARLWEFVSADPRESNTEGGILPAIFGTVMMVFLMSFVVAPFGVLAALYLREYAREGPLVRLVRIAVNNLAGVPSIVFGVFGLGFFVYMVGGTIDELFFADALPTPTFGTGGILWAALTLAILTVPVVIVATEEGLAAVPRAVREGSIALGATKLETMWRVVLPAAAPGILTGMILAMARAAGEVAPLMIVGMVKLAPTLPIDHHFPFIHFERKFMHLGFHIYDVGFQSPNVEATQPLVFATALLLVLLVTAMNLVAIVMRNRLRERYASSAV